ncbi:hypothetical protein FDB25_12640 [Clostridium botulinum]|nr:hypothetical protein [Clostridium botulinum]
MVSLKRFKEKSVVVNSIVEDVVHALSIKNPDLAEALENNYSELYNMILASCETWDCVLSDIEK